VKLKYLKISILLVIISFCCGSAGVGNSVNTSKLFIHQTPSKELVTVALNIVINKLDEEKIFTKQQMLNVLNNGHSINHDCKVKKHSLIISFTMGEWSKEHKKYCLLSEDKDLKGTCYGGFFKNFHTIEMLNKSKIYKSAFAHELLHYFRRHIEGPSAKGHEPKEFWENLVGYKAEGKIGILNEELKKAGL
jgi:hypothetical protein